MGADAKRKEARKRKFGATATETLATTESKTDNAETIANEPPKKRRKEKKEPEPMKVTSSKIPVSAVGEADDPTGVHDATAPALDTANQKAQRFIVFIGLYSLGLNYIYNRALTVMPKCQGTYRTQPQMNRLVNTLQRFSQNLSVTAPRRETRSPKDLHF